MPVDVPIIPVELDGVGARASVLPAGDFLWKFPTQIPTRESHLWKAAASDGLFAGRSAARCRISARKHFARRQKSTCTRCPKSFMLLGAEASLPLRMAGRAEAETELVFRRWWEIWSSREALESDGMARKMVGHPVAAIRSRRALNYAPC